MINVDKKFNQVADKGGDTANMLPIAALLWLPIPLRGCAVNSERCFFPYSAVCSDLSPPPHILPIGEVFTCSEEMKVSSWQVEHKQNLCFVWNQHRKYIANECSAFMLFIHHNYTVNDRLPVNTTNLSHVLFGGEQRKLHARRWKLTAYWSSKCGTQLRSDLKDFLVSWLNKHAYWFLVNPSSLFPLW